MTLYLSIRQKYFRVSVNVFVFFCFITPFKITRVIISSILLPTCCSNVAKKKKNKETSYLLFYIQRRMKIKSLLTFWFIRGVFIGPNHSPPLHSLKSSIIQTRIGS